jgi:hypothetical protein
MPRSAVVPALLATAALGGCSAAPLPPGFAVAAANAPEDQPLRLWVAGDAIVAAAAAVGRGGLPQPVRTAAEAIAPAGEMLFAGREWGPRGDGWRIEKHYRDGADESFRSVLLDDAGSVLERSHSVPPAKVPAPVLFAAMQVGRDVQRCEIVSGAISEESWRATVRDGAGRTFVVELGLDGRPRRVCRILTAAVAVR